jgi:hypothetical protein
MDTLLSPMEMIKMGIYPFHLAPIGQILKKKKLNAL